MQYHAAEVAAKWHGDQVRNYSGEPYVTHPIRVAKKVSEYYKDDYEFKLSEEKLATTALLHDTLEDTKISAEFIAEKFGDDVLHCVVELTSDKALLTRFADKAAYLTFKMKHMSKEALFIKLLDRLDNIESCVGDADKNADARKFADTYIAQTEKLLDGLKITHDFGVIIIAKIKCAIYDYKAAAPC